MSTYFTTSANGNAAISSTVYKIGSASYTNTSGLAVGTYTVTCTVTKVGGLTNSASMTLVVKSALPSTDTLLVRVEEYLEKIVTIPEGVHVIKLVKTRKDCAYSNSNYGWAVIDWDGVSENGEFDLYIANSPLYIGVTPGATYHLNYYCGGYEARQMLYASILFGEYQRTHSRWKLI